MHLDLLEALALTGLASPALDIEAEPARLVAADLRFPRLGEQLTDEVKHACVGGRVAARSSSDRRLVDLDDLVDLADSQHLAELARPVARRVEPAAQRPQQRLVHQSALAGARHAGDADDPAQRELDVDVLEVVLAASLEFYAFAEFQIPATRRRLYLEPPREVLAS